MNSNGSAAPNTQIKWDTPSGWLQYGANEMRLASFRIKDDKYEAECAIISLPDSGGSLRQNIHLWMRQIRMLTPPTHQFEQFLSKQQTFNTKSGARGILVDFTQVLWGDLTSDQSIISAVINFPGSTVFVKMSGNKNTIQKNKEKILSLSKSVEILND